MKMWIFFFERLYRELFGIEPKTNSIVNACVLADYQPLFGALFDGKEVGAVIKEFVQSKPYIIEQVKENSSEIFLYHQKKACKKHFFSHIHQPLTKELT